MKQLDQLTAAATIATATTNFTVVLIGMQQTPLHKQQIVNDLTRQTN